MSRPLTETTPDDEGGLPLAFGSAPVTGSGTYLPNLTAAQGANAVISSFSWTGSISFSIPGAGAGWSGYTAGSEPFDATYGVMTTIQATQFRLAMSLWDELIARPVTEVSDATPGQIRAAFTDTGGNWGYAYLPGAFSAVAGDIWIDSLYRSSSLTVGSYDFNALLHEIGHALGLKHTFEAPNALPVAIDTERASIMSYTAPTDSNLVRFASTTGGGIQTDISTVSFTTPSLYDIAAVQTLYGADTTTRSGNTTYTFDQNQALFQVIYDAGGTDVIDLSAHTRPSAVDLREGTYSSIAYFSKADQITQTVSQYGEFFRNFITSQIDRPQTYTWTDNVGIAFGVTIENVTFGSGDDRATGNGAGNVLRGNAGNDTLSGMAGNDTLDGGANDDQLTGGAGADSLIGGTGFDIVRYDDAWGVQVDILFSNAFGSTADGDRFAGIEGVSGSNTDDGVWGTDENNTIFTWLGNDYIDGRGGVDVLLGGQGNDTLVGGAGGDYLSGEAGADIFSYQTLTDSSLTTQDYLPDFSSAQGDKIDVSIFAGTATFNSGFGTGISVYAFSQSGGAWTMVQMYQGSTLHLQIVVNVASLSAGDFIL